MATSFSEAISRQPIRAFSIVTFLVCMLVLIADGMDAQLLGIVAPIVIEEYGVDRGTFGIAFMTTLVGFGLGSWGGGWLGDRIGRRWSLAIGTVIFSAATMGASRTPRSSSGRAPRPRFPPRASRPRSWSHRPSASGPAASRP